LSVITGVKFAQGLGTLLEKHPLGEMFGESWLKPPLWVAPKMYQHPPTPPGGTTKKKPPIREHPGNQDVATLMLKTYG